MADKNDPDPLNGSSLHIELTDRARLRGISKRPIQQVVKAVLTRHGCKAASISVVLVDDKDMSRLHADHLGLNSTTDVLTFDLSHESDCIEGEIVICADVAGREAGRRGHSIEAEIVLYVLHGVLHLLGYDDLTPRDAAVMHAQEDQVLHSLGWGKVYDTRHTRGRALVGKRK